MVQLASRRMSGQIDLPQISLELLIGIFRSDFLTEKYYVQWKNRQVIINFMYCFITRLLPIEYIELNMPVLGAENFNECYLNNVFAKLNILRHQ